MQKLEFIFYLYPLINKKLHRQIMFFLLLEHQRKKYYIHRGIARPC